MNHQFSAIILLTTLVYALTGCSGDDSTYMDEYGTPINSITGEPGVSCGNEAADSLSFTEVLPLGLTGQITKFLGKRHDRGGSQSAECWGVSTNHECDVPGDMSIQYVWTSPAGFVDDNQKYQIRFGIFQALSELTAFAAPNGMKFVASGGDKNMPINYGYNTAPCPAGAGCSASSAGYTSLRLDGASPQPTPSSFGAVTGIWKAGGYSSDFNLTVLINLAKTCYNTNTPSDVQLNHVGHAFGLHEMMHIMGWMHVTEVTPNIMNAKLTCDQMKGLQGGAPTSAQVQAMADFRAGTWNSGVLKTNVTLEQ